MKLGVIMSEPPKLIDGARVLAFAVITPDVFPTGSTTHRAKGEVQGLATGLAIARYDNREDVVYLFSCNSEWQVFTDTCHLSLDQAYDQAEFEYCGVTAHWQRCEST